jgi:beta-galactosidase
LNGKPIKLKGVNRHQDFAGIGSALSNDIHRKDIKLIKEMGSNFIRIAHYPQDPAFLDACDKEGILAWEEIPIVNFVPESPVFADNCKKNLKEMILQNYNHPSIVMWGYMNEVLLQADLRAKDQELKKQTELRTVKLAKELDSLAHKTDPSRLTTTAWHNSQIYNQSGMGDISKVIGWNLYVGNVASKFLEFGKLMDKEHEKYPDRNMFISEYGIGSDKRVHTLQPSNYDYSIEYQQLLHESIFPQILDRKFIIGSTVWNFIDFESPERQESTPHMNNKGLTYSNRVPKDVYFYYQAMFRTDPVIHIASRDWNERKGIPEEQGDQFVKQPVKIYSNVSKVELFLNGKSLGIKYPSNCTSVYEVPFVNGKNILVAKSNVQDSIIMDAVTVNFQVQPFDLRKSGKNLEIGINAGSNCFYTDPYSHFTYEPDQPYTREGSWGYVDNTDNSKTKSTTVDSKSTIQGTEQGPLFQTMREGAKAYKFDVPDGNYEITLMFAAPVSREDAIVNNVGGNIGRTFSKRVFNIYINGLLQLSNVDLAADYGSLTAVEKTINVKAINGLGVKVDLTPVKGLSIISALKLRRTD